MSKPRPCEGNDRNGDQIVIEDSEGRAWGIVNRYDAQVPISPGQALEMVENLQHQIKTPIFLAQRYARRLLQMTNDGGQAYAETAQLLLTSCNRAAHVAQDAKVFADLARNSGLAAVAKRVASRAIAERVSGIVRDFNAGTDHSRGIRFVSELEGFSVLDSVAVCLDLDLLDYMLFNILENAEKFSTHGSLVTVRAGLSQRNKLYFISISNRGVPIGAVEAEDLAKRGRPSTWKRREWPVGSGLGLYIVGEILKAHRGRLEVIPTTPQGVTEFRLLFPVQEGSSGGQSGEPDAGLFGWPEAGRARTGGAGDD